MKKIKAILIFSLIYLNAYSQAWEGSGNSIAFAQIVNDTIIFNYQDDDSPKILICENLNHKTKSCQLIDETTHEFKYNVPIEINLEFDTLKIQNYSSNHFESFIKKEKRNFTTESLYEITINYFETSLSNDLIEKITITNDWTIYFENLKTNSLDNFKLSEEEITRIKKTLSYFDYQGLNQSIGWRNHCNGGELGFTFTTVDKKQYSYIAMKVPEGLKEFKTLIYKLKEEKL